MIFEGNNMMTPEQLAEELKALHYTEKLVLAQKLIAYAYDELAQLSQQLAPLRSSSTMEVPESNPVEESAAMQQADGSVADKREKEAGKRQDRYRGKRSGVQETENAKIGSFNQLVQALRRIRCQKEAELEQNIMDLYKYRGGITPLEAKKIISRLIQKEIIAIDGNGMVFWRA